LRGEENWGENDIIHTREIELDRVVICVLESVTEWPEIY